MVVARSLWSWCFHVSDPKDPKLRGWLHPAFALTLNLVLAFAVSLAAFLSAPSAFHQEWLQKQPDSVLHAVQAVQHSWQASSVGFSSMPVVQWLGGTIQRAFLPAEALFDRKQAFTLYSWQKDGADPQLLAGSLLLYVAVMLSCRIYEKGPVMMYDMAWACNLSMTLTAVGGSFHKKWSNRALLACDRCGSGVCVAMFCSNLAQYPLSGQCVLLLGRCR